MFTLQIIFILLTGNQVGWLTNAFTYGKLICQQGEVIYMSEDTRLKTYHQFELPEGDWECRIHSYGSGFIFPSERDWVSRSFTTHSQ